MAVAICLSPIPGPPTKSDIMCIIENVSAIKLLNKGLVYLATDEIKAVQIAIRWKARRVELIGNWPD